MLNKVVLLLSLAAYCHGMQSLIDVIAANNGSTLASLLKQTKLDATLTAAGAGPFTILVPSDAAFAAIPAAELAALKADPMALADVLKYHVLAGEEFTYDIVNGRILQTVSNHSIRLYEQGGQVFFNDAQVLKSDLEATNAVIYVIDRVLDVPEGTIMNILDSKSHNLTKFAALLRKSGIDHRLNFASTSTRLRYTVFAPSNAAFDKLPVEAQKLLTGKYVRDIVDYHLHIGTIHVKGLDHDGVIPTLLRRHNIKIEVKGTEIRFNSKALLEESDIEADNGVVHVLDSVLIPSNLGSIIG